MREIKFKAKRKSNNEWVYGYLVEYTFKDTIYMDGTSPKQSYIFPMDERSQLKSLEKRIEVIPETISEYTGLKDKNGVEIYENDIVRAFFDFPYGEENIVGQVTFKIFGGLKIKVNNKNGCPEENFYPFEMLENIEVTENIYDKEVK